MKHQNNHAIEQRRAYSLIFIHYNTIRDVEINYTKTAATLRARTETVNCIINPPAPELGELLRPEGDVEGCEGATTDGEDVAGAGVVGEAPLDEGGLTEVG
jgi:hypothetical protein